MQTVKLEKLNNWARKSCARWNSNRYLRRFYRMLYRGEARRFWRSREHRETMSMRMAGIDSYPWPYCNPRFANWDETLDSLISDQSNCVIRYSTSYCAWKIFETTGHWPHKKTSERLDAKRWVQFLAESGYTQTATGLSPGHHYVGIDPTVGEYGLCVWAENKSADGFQPYLENGTVLVSTYLNKKYQVLRVYASDLTWVQID